MTTYLSSLKKYLIHIFQNVWSFNTKRKSFKKMLKVKEVSGISVTYYSWFSVKSGFYLKQADLPSEVNQFNIIKWKRLRRAPKRKAVNRTLGMSLTQKINEGKKRLINLIRSRKSL